MTLRQVSMATGGKGYPNFRRRHEGHEGS